MASLLFLNYVVDHETITTGRLIQDKLNAQRFQCDVGLVDNVIRLIVVVNPQKQRPGFND